MDIKKHLKEFKTGFDPRLICFLDRKEKQAKVLAPGYQQAVQEIKRLVKAGGKRIRPLMIYTSFRSCYGKNNKEVWNNCIAVELIHCFCLIHDDIMDASETRRGEISCYRKLGADKAILIGDVALILAEELVSQNAKHYFDLLKFEVAGGQWLDIRKFKIKNDKFKIKDVFKIMRLKTAMYTFARPLQIGACLAGADKKIIKAFFEYGIKIGIAFQIQDDILGVFGKEEETGKPVGDDIKEGKKTLLIAELLKNISTSEIDKINRIYGNKNASSKQVKYIKKLMLEYDVLKEEKRKMIQLIEEGEEILKGLEINKKEKQFLKEIGQFIISRSF